MNNGTLEATLKGMVTTQKISQEGKAKTNKTINKLIVNTDNHKRSS